MEILKKKLSNPRVPSEGCIDHSFWTFEMDTPAPQKNGKEIWFFGISNGMYIKFPGGECNTRQAKGLYLVSYIFRSLCLLFFSRQILGEVHVPEIATVKKPYETQSSSGYKGPPKVCQEGL